MKRRVRFATSAVLVILALDDNTIAQAICDVWPGGGGSGGPVPLASSTLLILGGGLLLILIGRARRLHAASSLVLLLTLATLPAVAQESGSWRGELTTIRANGVWEGAHEAAEKLLSLTSVAELFESHEFFRTQRALAETGRPFPVALALSRMDDAPRVSVPAADAVRAILEGEHLGTVVELMAHMAGDPLFATSVNGRTLTPAEPFSRESAPPAGRRIRNEPPRGFSSWPSGLLAS